MGDTKTEILLATRTALTEHGYGDLTTQKVADELGKSHSLIHYHFETKTDLLVAFVDFYRERVSAILSTFEDWDPGRRLGAILAFLAGNADDPDVRALNLAIYQMEADAYHRPELREALAAYDEMLVGFVEDTVVQGVETGGFADVDPAATARLIVSAIDGALLQQYTLDTDAVETVGFEALPTFVFEELYREPVPDLESLAAELDLEELARRYEEAGGETDG